MFRAFLALNRLKPRRKLANSDLRCLPEALFPEFLKPFLLETEVKELPGTGREERSSMRNYSIGNRCEIESQIRAPMIVFASSILPSRTASTSSDSGTRSTLINSSASGSDPSKVSSVAI